MNIIGAQQSIWMYAEGAAPKRVLVLSDITQISILKENNILCVLADRTLRAYSLLQLESIAIKGQKLLESTLASRTIASHISYFNSGVCNDKNLIVTMKRKGVESHFKVYEPTCGDLSHPKNSKYLTVKTSFISKSSTWFKVHQVR
jgi:hypothetical protein